ncbi:MAG: SDR family NAD(P)-dependent oxidoreductase [Pseudomonadota bacterium]
MSSGPEPGQSGQGRSVLITGCSSGIGLASALALKDRGWRVLATARHADDLARLKQDFGLETLELELADPESVARCMDDVDRLTDGQLFAVFNNGAYGQPGALEDLDVAVVRQQFEVNVFAAHEITRRAVQIMRANGTGRIVHCSSVLGLIAAPYRGAYCASKFALEAMADTMRLELAGTGIFISLIEPGPIDTRFLDHAMAAARANVDIEGSVHSERYKSIIAGMEKGGKQFFKLPPEAVAKKLIHAVESRRPKRRYYVTTPTYIVAAARRLLPTSALDWFAARN